MQLLRDVDKPGSEVEKYVVKLDEVLLMKIKKLEDLRKDVHDFYSNIKTEEMLN
jgi:kinesin family protein 2/24